MARAVRNLPLPLQLSHVYSNVETLTIETLGVTGFKLQLSHVYSNVETMRNRAIRY